MARKKQVEVAEDEVIEVEEEEVLEDEEEETLETTEEEEDRGDSFESEEEFEEEEEEGEEVEEEPTPPKIPKSRLDAVIKQREEAKERAAWLEEQLSKLIAKQSEVEKVKEPEVPAFDFDQAEEDYITFIIEGETAKASKLRSEINKARQAETVRLVNSIKESSSAEAKTLSEARIEEERFKNLVEALEVKHPYLNNKHKDFNEEAVETVNTLLAGYIAAGKSRSEGLKLAIAKVNPMYEKQNKPKTVAETRTKEAGKKAVIAAKSQPIKTRSSTSSAVDAKALNVLKMSERDFNSLTDKEKRLLRGD